MQEFDGMKYSAGLKEVIVLRYSIRKNQIKIDKDSM